MQLASKVNNIGSLNIFIVGVMTVYKYICPSTEFKSGISFVYEHVGYLFIQSLEAFSKLVTRI